MLHNLFNTVDKILGNKAIYRGLSFELPHGFLSIDYYSDKDLYICHFNQYGKEPISFLAVGEEELKEQLEEYVTKKGA